VYTFLLWQLLSGVVLISNRREGESKR